MKNKMQLSDVFYNEFVGKLLKGPVNLHDFGVFSISTYKKNMPVYKRNKEGYRIKKATIRTIAFRPSKVLRAKIGR